MKGMRIKRISVLNLYHVLKPFVKSTPDQYDHRHMYSKSQTHSFYLSVPLQNDIRQERNLFKTVSKYFLSLFVVVVGKMGMPVHYPVTRCLIKGMSPKFTVCDFLCLYM